MISKPQDPKPSNVFIFPVIRIEHEKEHGDVSFDKAEIEELSDAIELAAQEVVREALKKKGKTVSDGIVDCFARVFLRGTVERIDQRSREKLYSEDNPDNPNRL